MHLPVSFGNWLLVSVPLCTLSTLLAWMLITMIVVPDDIQRIPIIVYQQSPDPSTASEGTSSSSSSFSMLGGVLSSKRNVVVIVLSLATLLCLALFSFCEVSSDLTRSLRNCEEWAGCWCIRMLLLWLSTHQFVVRVRLIYFLLILY